MEADPAGGTAGPPYAAPRQVETVEECAFYHTIDVPGHGVCRGQWDLRRTIGDYLGHVTFAGRRVLDVGAASGFLTFAMEGEGAEVVSYDLSEEHSWDIVPFSGLDLAAMDRGRRAHLRAINNAYWFCHGRFGSAARMVHGTVYTVPDTIGEVDVAVFGAILLHVRDPFRALHNGVRLARDTVIVTDILPRRYRLARLFGGRLGTPQLLLPRAATQKPADCWWVLPPATVREFLAILGFGESVVTYHRQPFLGKSEQLYTIVAKRTAPTAPLI